MSSSNLNPFLYGNLIPAAEFVGRDDIIRHIVQRIVSRGQSTAVIGETGAGKSSLLDYLASEEALPLYELEERLLFSRVNFAEDTIDTVEYFWSLASKLLKDKDELIKLRPAYDICHQRNYDKPSLRGLIRNIHVMGWRWVLLIDDIHLAVFSEQLHKPEFYGRLRSLSTRSRGALTIIMTSRYSLTDLNKATQGLYRNGSPYFNFLSERPLGAFTDLETVQLLDKAKDRFSQEDRYFLRYISGQLPSLLQAAAFDLWDNYGDGRRTHATRWQRTSNELYGEAQTLLNGIWSQWSSNYRQAFLVVALNHLCVLLGYENMVRAGALVKEESPEVENRQESSNAS